MRLVPALFLALFAVPAAAQQSIYIGVGFSSFDFFERTNDPILGDLDDSTLKSKLFGGFEINDNFAFEISYAKTDELRDTATALFLVDDDDIPDEVSAFLETDFTITTLSAVGQIPLDWGVLLGGLGYFNSESDFYAAATAPCCDVTLSNSGSLSDDGMMAMLAVEWRFGRFGTRYGVRLEYEWWDMSDSDTSAIGVGISYGF